MRTILLSLFILLTTTTTAFSQSNWAGHKTIDGIKFNVQDMSCDEMDFKFIQIENTTSQKAKVSYQLEIRYDNSCTGCEDSPEYRAEITLLPGEKVAGGCNYTIPARLDILVANANLPNLRFVSFAIKNISVNLLD